MAENNFSNKINIKDIDIEMLTTLLLKGSNRNVVYDKINTDYENRNEVTISSTEYKLYLMYSYFIEELQKLEMNDEVKYKHAVDNATKQYKATMNVAKNVIEKFESKSSSNLFIPESNKIM